MATLDTSTLSVVRKALYQPKISEVAEVISKGLGDNFAEVSVEVVDCPDLTKEPFTLVCPGLCGKPQIFDIGGVSYLLPMVTRDRVYDVLDMCKLAESDPVYCIGAAAGPWPLFDSACEKIVNMSLIDGVLDQRSFIASVQPFCAPKGEAKLENIPENETRAAVLVNLFMSEGKPGKVLRVACKRRTGNDDFVSSIRKSLESKYDDKPVGLGGTFIMTEGKAKLHIMPEYSRTPLTNGDEVDDWLNYYEMSAPLINVGVLVSHDAGLDLRKQHFHTFSKHGEGGDYDIDTTPETVSYVGYFSIAETVVRVDEPKTKFSIGRP